MTHSHKCPPKPTPCKWCRAGVPVMQTKVPAVKAVSKAKQKGLCAYLGSDTGERRTCESCGGKVTLKVLSCTVHGRCTVAKPVDGLPCCSTCINYFPGAT